MDLPYSYHVFFFSLSNKKYLYRLIKPYYSIIIFSKWRFKTTVMQQYILYFPITSNNLRYYFYIIANTTRSKSTYRILLHRIIIIL